MSEDDDRLLADLGALPTHDVRPELRDAIAERAKQALASEARPPRGVMRLYRALELPMLGVAAAIYLCWTVMNVAQIHADASKDLSPTIAAADPTRSALYGRLKALPRTSPRPPLPIRERGLPPMMMECVQLAPDAMWETPLPNRERGHGARWRELIGEWSADRNNQT